MPDPDALLAIAERLVRDDERADGAHEGERRERGDRDCRRYEREHTSEIATAGPRAAKLDLRPVPSLGQRASVSTGKVVSQGERVEFSSLSMAPARSSAASGDRISCQVLVRRCRLCRGWFLWGLCWRCGARSV
jgi:hypothetical protein